MVKLRTSKGDIYIEFEYNLVDLTTTARLLKKVDGVENSFEMLTEDYAMLAKGDKWNRRIGRKIALSRAFSNMNFSREERGDLWLQFFAQCRVI